MSLHLMDFVHFHPLETTQFVLPAAAAAAAADVRAVVSTPLLRPAAAAVSASFLPSAS